MKLSRLVLMIMLLSLTFLVESPAQLDGDLDSGNLMPYKPDARMWPFIDSLLAGMTPEEKLGQLAQFRWQWREESAETRDEYRRFIREGRAGSFLGISGTQYLGELQRIAVEESRLKIPLLFAEDVIHGYRTTFPIPLGESASWDPQAVEQAARIAAVEATAAGLHWTFAPMVDIARDPRWGRIIEGSGEDPYLGSVLAAARVRGFQGTNLALENTLIACAKHFAAYGGAEGGRDYNTVDISERTLREIYLPPFHAAVQAGVQSVMGAFNEIGGVPMHASKYLITDLLRGEWGFRGVLVSDYTAVEELQKHGIAGDRAEAGMAALRAGVDIDMVSGIYQQDLPALLRAGELSEALVDSSVKRVLRVKYILGLFDDPFRYIDKAREESAMLAPEHIAHSRELASKSIVLLKNEVGILPLSKELKSIAVIGALADDRRSQLGSWKALGRPEDAVSVLEGIRQAVGKNTKINFSEGYDTQDFDDPGKIAAAVKAARQSDAVILVLGETSDMSGEAASRSSIDLPGVQDSLAALVIATGKPVVAVLMNGRPLAISGLAGKAPAIVEAWFLGVQMGPAVADVLFGDYNPGGKLPVTFPRTTGQIPIYYNHKNTGRPPAEEKYTSKYLELPSTPLYPFGFGLSYTQFEYSNLTVNPQEIITGDSVLVKVDVRNTGNWEGDEVVQLYIRDEVASVTRPVKDLRGFRRIRLAQGEKKTVSFTLTMDDLAFYNLDMKLAAEPGNFRVFVGTSSADVLESSFKLTGNVHHIR